MTGAVRVRAQSRRDGATQSNRIEARNAGAAERFLAPLLACLEQQIATIEAKIAGPIETFHPLRKAVGQFQAISGISATMTAALNVLDGRENGATLGQVGIATELNRAGHAARQREHGNDWIRTGCGGPGPTAD